MRSSRSHKRHCKTVSSVREENKNTSSVKCGETVDNNVTVDNNDLGTYSSISNTANTVYSGLILLLYFYSHFFVITCSASNFCIIYAVQFFWHEASLSTHYVNQELVLSRASEETLYLHQDCQNEGLPQLIFYFTAAVGRWRSRAYSSCGYLVGARGGFDSSCCQPRRFFVELTLVSNTSGFEGTRNIWYLTIDKESVRVMIEKYLGSFP